MRIIRLFLSAFILGFFLWFFLNYTAVLAAEPTTGISNVSENTTQNPTTTLVQNEGTPSKFKINWTYVGVASGVLITGFVLGYLAGMTTGYKYGYFEACNFWSVNAIAKITDKIEQTMLVHGTSLTHEQIIGVILTVLVDIGNEKDEKKQEIFS